MYFYILLFIVILFSVVVFFGAPYLPTMKKQADAALDLLDLKPGQTLLELGSGDGRVAVAAAKRGLRVVGYELNPFLVVISLVVTFKYRKKVKIIWGDYWKANWPKADGIYVFLITKYMKKLNTKINDYPYKPVRLASFAFRISNQKPIKKKEGVFLYRY
jgi:16S rRNA A1518/A1519 N6-dimethyltransferase RsmA/KsgA/DIM1 with predicted DNA glycosylase/AP lyase activity